MVQTIAEFNACDIKIYRYSWCKLDMLSFKNGPIHRYSMPIKYKIYPFYYHGILVAFSIYIYYNKYLVCL